MKQFFILAIAGISACILMSCTGTSEKSVTVDSGSISKYSTIQVGSLSIDRGQWKELSYKSEQEYDQALSSAEETFRNRLKENLAGKKIIFGRGAAEVGVSFSNSKVDRGYKFGAGPWGSISTTVTITDMKTKKVVYEATLEAVKAHSFSHAVQLQQAAQQIADQLAKRIAR